MIIWFVKDIVCTIVTFLFEKNAKFCKSVFVKIIDILFNVKIFEQFSELMKSNHQHIFRNEHILTIQLCMTETKAVDTIGNYSK